MSSDLGFWISTFGVIFAIIDPFGYVPVFLTMTSDVNVHVLIHEVVFDTERQIRIAGIVCRWYICIDAAVKVLIESQFRNIKACAGKATQYSKAEVMREIRSKVFMEGKRCFKAIGTVISVSSLIGEIHDGKSEYVVLVLPGRHTDIQGS